jgi:hypothetical protein
MADTKKKITEGLIYTLVDKFFQSLEKGAADKINDKVKKTDIHPDVKNAMQKVIDSEKQLRQAIDKHYNELKSK